MPPQLVARLVRRAFTDGLIFLGAGAASMVLYATTAVISGLLGGADALSEVERQLARRCATLSVQAEAMEAATAGGDGELDVDQYVVITNALGRAAARIGLRRRMKDATPDLRSYLTERAQAS